MPAIALGAVVLSLGGCAAVGGETSPESSTPPASAFVLDCNQILAAEDLSHLFGFEPVVVWGPPAETRLATSYETALKQDGALDCVWGSADGDPSLTLFALQDAAEGFDHFRPAFSASDAYLELDIFDGSYYRCSYGLGDQQAVDCIWQLLAGDVWLTVTQTGLLDAGAKPGSEASPSLVLSEDSPAVGVLMAITDAILDAPRQEVARTVDTVGSCSELIQANALAPLPENSETVDVIAPGTPLLGVSTADNGDPMWAVSMQRLGYRYCSVMPAADGYNATTVVVAPGGSWAFDPSLMQPLDTLDSAYYLCASSSDGSQCTVAALRGETLVTVVSYEAAPEVSLAILKNVLLHL